MCSRSGVARVLNECEADILTTMVPLLPESCRQGRDATLGIGRNQLLAWEVQTEILPVN